MRILRGIVQVLTGHYVQVVFAWIGLIFVLLTVPYWIRIYYAQDQAKKDSINQQYAESVGCFGCAFCLVLP